MDILLIEPPHSILKGLPTDRAYNVGLTSLAAYIHREGIETAVLMADLLIDFPQVNPLIAFIREFGYTTRDLAEGQREVERVINDKNHVIWKKLSDAVKQANPRAVGIAYLTPLKCIVERVAGLVKEVNPDIKIVVGSFHPTFCPEEVMQNPDIDFVIRGEGEIPLLHLVKEIKKDAPKWEAVPGIYYRDRDGQVRNNPGAGALSNLDELPFIARDLVLNCDFNIHRVHSISSARGCPYTCAFCSDRRFWGGKVRRRSVDNIITELKLLKEKYNADVVDFVDGTFTFDRGYLQTFCNALINQKLNIKWRCTARYDNLDEELLQLMKKSNCAGMYLGLESGSNRSLKVMDKKETIENIIKVANMIQKSGIITVTSVLFGLPDDDKEDVEETLKIMRKFKTEFFDVNSYMPLPGSPLYDAMSDEEKRSVDWRKVAYKSFDNYFSKKISPEDFRRYLTEAYKIADNKRRKSLVRLAVGMSSYTLSRVFRRDKGESSQSPFSYS
jgi:anaerobic magnesium-protoporphyrin IX monomethyl ester cyclase